MTRAIGYLLAFTIGAALGGVVGYGYAMSYVDELALFVATFSSP